MVKTRSDLKGVRVSAKAPRKISTSTSTNSPKGQSKRKYTGGNSVCHREVPEWQKQITKFFPVKSRDDGSSSSNSSSSSSEPASSSSTHE